MNSYIAILRGINVTGHRKLPMADLRNMLAKAGFENVSTYIQSGNVLFAHREENRLKIAQEISDLIKKQFSYDVPVIVFARNELEKVANNNPFVNERNEDPKYLHVTFLSQKPDKDKLKELEQLNFPNEEYIIAEKAVYLFCPKGYGTTKLSNNFFENKLKVTATTRNWKTVNKLLELSAP